MERTCRMHQLELDDRLSCRPKQVEDLLSGILIQAISFRSWGIRTGLDLTAPSC